MDENGPTDPITVDALFKHAIKTLRTAYGDRQPPVTTVHAGARLGMLALKVKDGRAYKREKTASELPVRIGVFFNYLACIDLFESGSLAEKLRSSLNITQHRNVPRDAIQRNPELADFFAIRNEGALHSNSFANKVLAYTRMWPEQIKVGCITECFDDVSSVLQQFLPPEIPFFEMKDRFARANDMLLAQMQMDAFTLDFETQKARMSNWFLAKSGPDSIETLLMCQLIYNAMYVRSSKLRTPQTEKIGDLLLRLTRASVVLVQDVNFAKHADEFASNKAALQEVSELDLKFQDIIGMTRYFIEHHGDKIPVESASRMRGLLHSIYCEVCSFEFESMSESGFPFSKDVVEKVADPQLYAEFIEFVKPSVEEVLEKRKKILEAANMPRQFRKLETLQPPDGMESFVTLYATPHPDFRQQRDADFSRRREANGEDAVRGRFIKKIARDHEGELLAAGLPRSAIHRMQETGAMPRNDEGMLYNLTIDHEIDRQMGGGNLDHNLIFLSADINQHKSQLVEAQLHAIRLAGDNNDRWIVSWRPKILENGNKPKIIVSGGKVKLIQTDCGATRVANGEFCKGPLSVSIPSLD